MDFAGQQAKADALESSDRAKADADVLHLDHRPRFGNRVGSGGWGGGARHGVPRLFGVGAGAGAGVQKEASAAADEEAAAAETYLPEEA
ncbi:hypothetical protein GCM10009714_37050 [Microlunatus capsulatus]